MSPDAGSDWRRSDGTKKFVGEVPEVLGMA